MMYEMLDHGKTCVKTLLKEKFYFALKTGNLMQSIEYLWTRKMGRLVNFETHQIRCFYISVWATLQLSNRKVVDCEKAVSVDAQTERRRVLIHELIAPVVYVNRFALARIL